LVVTTNQRFPIFFAEKRPFFLEGIDIFRTLITAVHTRAIVDPDIAVKLSGKRGRNTFGLMMASDNGPGNLSADDRGNLTICLERRAIDPRLTSTSLRSEGRISSPVPPSCGPSLITTLLAHGCARNFSPDGHQVRARRSMLAITTT
jgi:hypothetical protein